MITKRQIINFIQRHKITVNKLAEASGLRPYILYRFLGEKKTDITQGTAERIKKGMRKVENSK